MDHKYWELPHNAGNRPPNWKTKINNETANMSQDMDTDQRVELLLSNVDRNTQFFPEYKDMLKNPNIWIGDTAATVHMTSHEDGMVDIKNMNGSITVGNGQTMMTTKTGNIKCEIPNKRDNTTKTGLLTDVCLTKSSPFNLFSLTKMMKSGWRLGGSYKDGIALSKGTDELKFDIPIETPKGIVYAIDIRRIRIKDQYTSAQKKDKKKKDKKKKVSKTKTARKVASGEERNDTSKAPDIGWIVVRAKRATSNVQENYTDSLENVGQANRRPTHSLFCGQTTMIMRMLTWTMMKVIPM
jgi:cation transport regulator ChaB